MEQLSPTEEVLDMMNPLGCSSRKELNSERVDMFGFVLGVMMGDASKPERGRFRFPSRTISLTLSHAKPNSFKLGEFTTNCVNASLGLAMHRIADAPSSEGRFTTAECFRWLSPASPLLAWAFHGCMGYKEGERTTYDPARMDWILNAPRSFQTQFFQGMTESDGWVDAGADRAKFVSSPNERLFNALLNCIDIPYKLYAQPSITRIEVPTEKALTIPFFSEKMATNNYEELVIMATAKRFEERIPIPEQFIKQIEPILRQNKEYNRICLDIASTTGYKISSETVKKYKQLADT